MISLKKGLFALCFGIGLSFSLNATALPGCYTCAMWYEQCAAGDSYACYQHHHYECDVWYPNCTSTE